MSEIKKLLDEARDESAEVHSFEHYKEHELKINAELDYSAGFDAASAIIEEMWAELEKVKVTASPAICMNIDRALARVTERLEKMIKNKGEKI